jgi:hypothetical protein
MAGCRKSRGDLFGVCSCRKCNWSAAALAVRTAGSPPAALTFLAGCPQPGKGDKPGPVVREPVSRAPSAPDRARAGERRLARGGGSTAAPGANRRMRERGHSRRASPLRCECSGRGTMRGQHQPPGQEEATATCPPEALPLRTPGHAEHIQRRAEQLRRLQNAEYPPLVPEIADRQSARSGPDRPSTAAA